MKLLDTTLRDGEQAIRPPQDQEETQHDLFERYARAAAEYANYIEAGIPISNPEARSTVESIAAAFQHRTDTTILAFARARKRDIDIACESVSKAARHGISLLTSVSSRQLKKFKVAGESHKGRSTRMLGEFRKHVEYARGCLAHPHQLLVYLEDSTRTELKYLFDLCQAFIEAGTDIISVPDTVGHVNRAADYAELVLTLRQNVPGSERVLWSGHMHNDKDIAVEATLQAMEKKAIEIVEGTINGFGERCGNARLTSVIGNVYAPGTHRYPGHCHFEKITKTNLKNLAGLEALGNKALGIDPSPYASFTGENAHKTAAGMHQDGRLKEREMFESYPSEMFGVDGTEPFVFTHQSGRKGLQSILRHRGIRIKDDVLERTFQDAAHIAGIFHGKVESDFLEAAAWQAVEHPRRLALRSYKVIDQEKGKKRCTVEGELIIDGDVIAFEGTGNGPTSAFVDGLNTVLVERLGVEVDVRDWFERAEIPTGDGKSSGGDQETPGREARVWSFVQMRVNGDVLHGYGKDANGTYASFQACLQAVNRWYTMQQKSKKKKAMR
jgi:2-isopropylmalate synthase